VIGNGIIDSGSGGGPPPTDFMYLTIQHPLIFPPNFDVSGSPIFTWVAPNGAIFAGANPDVSNFTQTGTYQIACTDWSAVTGLTANSVVAGVVGIDFSGVYALLPNFINLTSLGSTDFVGTLVGLPRALTALTITGAIGLTGPVTDLPTGLTILSVPSTGVTGSLAQLKVTCPSLLVLNAATTALTGTIADLPVGLTSLDLSHTVVSGSVTTLPTTLVTVGLTATSVTGDLSLWAPAGVLSSILVSSTALTYGTGGSLTHLTLGAKYVNFTDCALVSGNVNNVLADLVTGAATHGTAMLAGTNATPTGAGLTNKATLVTRTWTVTTN
jgi:hypothetical protein